MKQKLFFIMYQSIYHILLKMQQNWNQHYFAFVEANMDKPWSWYWLSSNPNITWDAVKANLDKPWSWYWLSSNPNITLDIVEANMDKHWSWYELSSNPNITLDIVEANMDKPWSWKGLSSNTFEKDKEMFELRVKKQQFIQENVFEELVKIAMHPKRIEKYLDMGYNINDLDDLL